MTTSSITSGKYNFEVPSFKENPAEYYREYNRKLNSIKVHCEYCLRSYNSTTYKKHLESNIHKLNVNSSKDGVKQFVISPESKEYLELQAKYEELKKKFEQAVNIANELKSIAEQL